MRVVGTDIDPEQISEARKLYSGGENLHFQVEDAANLSFQNNSFDLVIAHNIFHNIPAREVAVREVRRVLCPKDHLMWLDIVSAKPIRGLLSAIGKGKSFFSLEEVTEAFTDSGLGEQFHERVPLLVFVQHHFVLQRT